MSANLTEGNIESLPSRRRAAAEAGGGGGGVRQKDVAAYTHIAAPVVNRRQIVASPLYIRMCVIRSAMAAAVSDEPRSRVCIRHAISGRAGPRRRHAPRAAQIAPPDNGVARRRQTSYRLMVCHQPCRCPRHGPLDRAACSPSRRQPTGPRHGITVGLE